MEAGREKIGYESVQLPDSGFAVVEPRAVERWGISGWEAVQWIDRCRSESVASLMSLTILVVEQMSESRGARRVKAKPGVSSRALELENHVKTNMEPFAPSTLRLSLLSPAESSHFLSFTQILVFPLAFLGFGENLLRLLRVPVIAESRELAGGSDGGFLDFGKHVRFASLGFDKR